MSQPLDQVYQNPVMTNQPSPPRSNGSFGPVFIVLAVIVLVSAVACVLGRICSKRHNKAKEGSHKQNKASKQTSQGLGPKEWESRQKPSFNARDGDIEFGFDKKSSKGAKVGGGKTQPVPYNAKPTSYNGNPTSYGANQTSYNGNPTPSYNGNPTPYNANTASYNGNPTPYNTNGGHRGEQVRYADNV